MSFSNFRFLSESPAGEWLSSTHYEPLAHLDRHRWAWLWLKRNPDYQMVASHISREARWDMGGAGEICARSHRFEDLF